MAKLTLEIEADFDFNLIGVCSHIKDYRLSWELNKELDFDLTKDKNYELSQHGENQSHTFYTYCNDDDLIDYYLINNRSELGLLIPEESKCDFFLIIKGAMKQQDKKELIKQIANLKHVLTAYEIDVESLKSKNNLLF